MDTTSNKDGVAAEPVAGLNERTVAVETQLIEEAVDQLRRTKGDPQYWPAATIGRLQSALVSFPLLIKQGAEAMLHQLRANGWSVAVHNDYRLDNHEKTFWLFTHPCGRWVKGEGATDEEALRIAYEQAALPAPTPHAGGGMHKIIEAADCFSVRDATWALTIEWPDGTETVEHVSDQGARALGYVPDDGEG